MRVALLLGAFIFLGCATTPAVQPAATLSPPPRPHSAPIPTLLPLAASEESAPLGRPPAPGPLGFIVFFIDVGQGDATLITTPDGHAMLIDGGRSRSRIRDRLETMGVTDLDAVVATHADADHIAGLLEALEMFDVERYYWNGAEHDSKAFLNLVAAVAAEGSEVAVVERGDTIRLGELEIDVLHPFGLTGDSNVDSVVLQVGCGEVEVLLMADAEAPSEASLIQSEVLSDVDVLKIGHHGSRSSTTPGFIRSVIPEWGVISAGLNSQYGHPHEEVLQTLEAEGVVSILTDTTEGDDTVTMVTDCQQVLWP